MLDNFQLCNSYDIECHVARMTISSETKDPECKVLLDTYRNLNSSGLFLQSAQAINMASSFCSLDIADANITILANYFSPLGSQRDAADACNKLSLNRRLKLKEYLAALNINYGTCSSGLTQEQDDAITQNDQIGCDFTCQVKRELSTPNPETIAGKFAIKFNLFKDNPDLLSKLALYFEKKYGVIADISSIRDHGARSTLAAEPVSSHASSIEFHRGTMPFGMFNYVLMGAEYAKALSQNKADIVIDDAENNVIPYANSNLEKKPILSLGGAPLFNNKTPGLSQVFSLYGSAALALANEAGWSSNTIVISDNNAIYSQLKRLMPRDNLILLDNTDSQSALDVVKDISEGLNLDSSGQPIVNANITLIGTHLFTGFVAGTIKVHVSSKSKINWLTIPTNMKKFTQAEIIDMPGYKPLIPSSVSSIYNAFTDKVSNDEALTSNFAHYLVGYHTYLILAESDTSFDCTISDYPKRTESGDFILCP